MVRDCVYPVAVEVLSMNCTIWASCYPRVEDNIDCFLFHFYDRVLGWVVLRCSARCLISLESS